MWEYNYNPNSDELYHYGVLGMKWGVRRYQNKNGSLTPAGKKRYEQMTPDKLQKTLYKQVKAKRSDQTSWINKWGVSNTIGPNSKAAQNKYLTELQKYKGTDEYKSAMKKIKNLDRKADAGKITGDDYDVQYNKIIKSVYKPEFDSSVTFNKGRKYVKEYLDKYGSDINIGYLKDLGYSEGDAKWINKKIMTANRKMLDGM